MTALGWRRGEDNLDLAPMGCDITHHLRKILEGRLTLDHVLDVAHIVGSWPL
jgi:hypothetical protein